MLLRIFAIMIIACVANYWLFIPSSIIIIGLVLFRHYYLRTSRNLQRLEALGILNICMLITIIIFLLYTYSARSPLYSHISATIQGLSCIRALHEQSRFLNKFHYYQNEHTKAWYLKFTVSRWFGMRIDLIGSLFLMMIAFSSIPLADSKHFYIFHICLCMSL